MKHQAAGAKDTVDLLPAYQTLMHGPDDGHSYIQPPQENDDIPVRRRGDGAVGPGGRADDEEAAAQCGGTKQLTLGVHDMVWPAGAGSLAVDP